MHSVKEYCDLLHTTRHQLNTMTKEHSGHTSKEIINNRLLQEIKIELQYSNKTITEIANALNFSEANNLTRFLKKLASIATVGNFNAGKGEKKDIKTRVSMY